MAKRADPVLSRRLRVEEGQVGAGDEVAGAGGVGRCHGHPHAHGEAPLGRKHGRGDGVPEPLRQGQGLIEAGTRKDDRELLAPDAAQHVLGPGGPPGHSSQRLEDLVARKVAVDVVHPLEVVDVVDEEPHPGPLPAGPPDLLAEPLVEIAVVVEAGEMVGDHLGLEPRPDLGVVQGEGGELSEPDRQVELLPGEVVRLPEAVQAQGPLGLAPRDQGDGDQ
ncbi:MAG TPA: hypothetical protein VGR49_03560 [Actinomycetota bacterium]|nr:hypothetical protein [Actinomycetota bacterium]